MASNSDLSLREARAIYFAANSIPPDGRYSDSWVHVRIGPIPFAFPNTTGRRRVLAAHDLHHVLTGYKTNIRGEGALAAWEIGAGCRDRTGLRLLIIWPAATPSFTPRFQPSGWSSASTVGSRSRPTCAARCFRVPDADKRPGMEASSRPASSARVFPLKVSVFGSKVSREYSSRRFFLRFAFDPSETSQSLLSGQSNWP